ncbi:acyltransferase [Rothia sp. ZJ932]|uniref:acyltransferase family protein n=1 Tax=Rothia sp. ZJ932 TaxID=2810516 RepID=UPI0019674530|nr:acyltransferase [Rothia sp. ZJ932]QRZ61850.1 acyltransferase [Rothia sp. ZJ932]
MNRYGHIDAMRAFAVLLVVFSHAGLSFVPGGSGVTIFFVISGFIITYLLLREREKTGGFGIGGFYMRRLIKIAPPLVLIIVIPTLLYMASGGSVDILDFLGQIFFFLNWRYLDSNINVFPGTHVTWSLSIEEQFYLVFALIWLVAVKSKNYLKIITRLSIAVALYSFAARVLLYLAGASNDRIYFGTDTRVEAIAIGTLTAIWYFKHRSTEYLRGTEYTARHGYEVVPGEARERSIPVLGQTYIPVVAVALYLVSLVIRDEAFRETLRYSMQAIAAALVILWGLTERRGALGQKLHDALQWRVLQVLGLSSYSIYLLHDVVNKALEPYFEHLPVPVSLLVLVVLGIAGGVAIWKFIELPAQAFKDRHFASANTKAEMAATSERNQLETREAP